MNSASLRFIPADKLEAEGYGEYAHAVRDRQAAPAPAQQDASAEDRETAMLAGGCFWGMEELLRKIPGVLDTRSATPAARSTNPHYEDTSRPARPATPSRCSVVFDPDEAQLRDAAREWFFRMHDPTTLNRQGNDVGTQYRSAIFYTTDEQRAGRRGGEGSASTQSGKWKRPDRHRDRRRPTKFYPAEDYHQDYLQKQPGRLHVPLLARLK